MLDFDAAEAAIDQRKVMENSLRGLLFLLSAFNCLLEMFLIVFLLTLFFS